MLPDIIRVLFPAGLAFALGIAMTPVLTHYLYSLKAWKKKAGKTAYDGTHASEFNRLHSTRDINTPRFGGIIIWGSVGLTAGILAFLPSLEAFDFLSRSQTWVPLSALMVGALAGFLDDLFIIRPRGEGLKLRYRLLIVVVLSSLIGWWFYDKLDVTGVQLPFDGLLEFGFLIVPFFILTSLALYASGVIDGLDGLSGGVFLSVFASYAIIAFSQNQIDLAAFCAALCGGLLAFLWFNIPPARFYMSDTGSMALTLTIPTIAFMTDELGGGIGVAVLPVIGFLLVITVASDILQMIWKQWFGKKLFRIAPLHHHFEAIGWTPEKVVMRYWVLAIVFAFLGVILALTGK